MFLTPAEAETDGALTGMAEGEIAARSVRNFSFLDGDSDDEITRKEYEAAVSGTSSDEASGEEQAANAEGVPVFIWWYE